MNKPLKYSVERGFTLIELMVVMVIVTVLITAVSMTLKRDYQDLAVKEIKRFRSLVFLAYDESFFQARLLAISFDKDGYEFMIKNDRGEWLPMDDYQLHPRKLPKGFELEVFLDEIAVDLERKEDRPHVFLFPTDERMPFDVTIRYPERAFIRLQFDEFGQHKLTREE